jgi:predicted dehydrogenase
MIVSRAPRRVLLVGLGTIARTHHEVLAADPAVEIVGGVDPQPGLRTVAPLFSDLDEAFAAGLDPDLVVVATPTETHIPLVSDLLGRCDAMVLSEKPLAATTSAVAELEGTHGRDVVASRVRVAHHFAFSPEVEWARGVVAHNPGWGTPSRITCVFNDAYAKLPPAQLAGYVSSWVDSGPNQLSVVAAFAGDWTVRTHADEVMRAVTTLEHAGGLITLSSNWLAADTSKQTVVEFEDAGVQVRIDHTSMTALVVVGGEVVTHAAYSGTLGRKAAHYDGLYRALFADPDDERLSVALARSVAEALDAGVTATGTGGVSWTTTNPPAT